MSLCSIAECNRRHKARGWCERHYRRWLRYGDPHADRSYIQDPEERFWSKVDASGDCWEWTAYINKEGYGSFGYEGTMKKVHRLAWEFLVGSIPEDYTIDHLCRNRSCVNPDHLEPVTRQENIRRGVAADKLVRRLTQRTHCIRGHPFSGANLYIRPDTGTRQCRECGRIRARKAVTA